MTAAEIIHEHAHAQLVQLAQRAPRRLDVLDEDALRDLERQPLWIETKRLQHVRHLFHQVTIHELTNRQIHPHRFGRVVAVVTPPELTLAARLLQYPTAHLRDESRLFGDMNEIAGRHETALGMLPTQ